MITKLLPEYKFKALLSFCNSAPLVTFLAAGLAC